MVCISIDKEKVMCKMGTISEEEFNMPDPNNPAYSMVEYDLYARMNLSIRKNLRNERFEIFDLWTGNVIFTGNFRKVVKEAKRLEGAEDANSSYPAIFRAFAFMLFLSHACNPVINRR